MYTDKPFTIKRGDRKPYYEADLRDADGTPVPGLGAAAGIEFRMSHRHNEKKVTGEASVIDPDAARIRYAWAEGDTDLAGEFLVTIRVEWEEGVYQSFPSDGYKTVIVQEQVGV